MKAPRFWYATKSNWRAALLSPLAKLYERVSQKRLMKPGYKAGIPVICVGNVNIGGVGKTPTVIYLNSVLQAAGFQPMILTRGYKGSAEGPLLATDQHHANEIGDEAALLAMFGSVIVAKDREAGAQFAENAGADVIIMDDGFQNPTLEKDISLIVLDREIGLGNGRIFPAGPLRESLESADKRADGYLLMGAGNALAEHNGILRAKPCFEGKIAPIAMGVNWSKKRVVAFAGIGRPEKFFATLRSLGAELVDTHGFGDHEVLSEQILQRMHNQALRENAQLVTTEKDAMRLPPAWQSKIMSLPVRLSLENDALADWLLAELRAGPQKP